MAMTRGMTAKQNQYESNRKKLKTLDDNGRSASWAYVIPDILFSIILRLGYVDFVSFSSVCKPWRVVALTNKTAFLLSRQPMTMRVCTRAAKRKKECWLEDHEGRKFMTTLPHSSGRICVGLASGYVILFRRKTQDFRLVNPITRHELYFPRFPFKLLTNPEALTGTLAFSPTVSKWVFVISARFSRTVSFSLSSRQASWTHLFSNTPICDLQFFQGKIYTMNTGASLYEVKLDPKPTLTPLEMQNSVVSRFILPQLSTFGGKLFVTGYLSDGRYGSLEVDFDQMKWVSAIALKGCACFASGLKCCFNILDFWEEPHTLYARFGYFNGVDKDKKKHIRNTTNMWYFLNKCLDVNILHA